MLTCSTEAKGRAALTLAKGPSKKRSRAEFEENRDDLKLIKQDKWTYLHQTKRLRVEVEQMREIIH